jgi:phosphatidylserine/phosphatidylglycerophosphate/cardiolipin synthase-like enzyme
VDSNALKRTAVEVLQYDPRFSDVKNELYPIVSRSTVNCVPQFGFATRSYQHWEDVEIRVPVPMISKATELKSKIDDLIYYVYEESDDYAIQDVKLRPQIIYSDVLLEGSNSVEFDRIQEIIVQGIRDAKYLIWVAVAWFSNDVLYQELLNKKEDGLNIRVIVSDEDSNQILLPKIQKNFECVVVPHTGRWETNRMHDKFCIVDLDYIMHGSYNWTKAANYNGETLVTTVDRELVRDFADEFLKMYNENR